ncbi:uncharacterized protein LOC115735379 [Rhodamnia argentea]|uniref:Uncharacterized protein LOC115735379 n=1 Tax=Rhodamnia argentea TaxID=178133 RepID=A0A8B8NK78_9MYRT|nr:uncharacterized protein LOC115735379 [Rhodamnia argentea]
MASLFPNDSGFSHVSAPASPDAPRVTNASLFYSTPASPCRENEYPPYNLDAGKLDPIGSCDQTSSDSDLDFEFKTSWGCVIDTDEFIKSQDLESPLHKKSRPRGDSLPSMAFADELFCDGKVMPLKPPPCSYYESKNGNQSPIGSPSPRSLRSGFKVSFQRRSRWNDDFDPFIVALENVKGDSRARRTTQANDHRRTRSLSPFRGFKAESPRRSTDLRGRNHQENERETPRAPVKPLVEPLDHANPPFSKWVPNQRKQASLQQLDQNPIQSPKQREPHGKVEEGQRENGECIVRESKRQRIRRFLLRTTSSSCDGTKEGDEKVKANWRAKVSILRRLSFESTGSGGATPQNDEQRRVPSVAKMTLVQYRPRLFLCLGFGLKRRSRYI